MANFDAYPHRCQSCRLRHDECVCGDAPHLSIATRLIVVMHAKEWGKSTNTGHLVKLALRDGEVRIHGLRHQPVNSEGFEVRSASTLVLFPGRGANPLTPAFIANLPRPLTLLVPDGNWNQAKNMMRRLPMFQNAHPVCLEGSNLDFSPLRKNVQSDRMSTYEAIAQALGVLEGRATEETMLRFFWQVLDTMRRTKGAVPKIAREHF